MTKEEIISGLEFTIYMFMLDPTTGETYEEPMNNMDKTTIDACKGAIELLERSNNEVIGTKEILNIIHEKGIETEIFKALSIWLINKATER